MKSEFPLVSVLITSFNRQKYIEEAIKSVLSQTYQHFELIIVDDCSQDDTYFIASKFIDSRIKLFRNSENLGQFANRNRAIEYAKGYYIKFLDSDDFLHQDALFRYVEAMNISEGINLCVPFKGNSSIKNLEIFEPRNALLAYYFNKGLQLDAGPTGIMFRTAALQGIRFEEIYGINADVFFNLKLSCTGSVIALENKYSIWRKHHDQIDSQQKDKIRMIIERSKINVDFLRYQFSPLTLHDKKTINRNLIKINSCNLLHFIINLNFKSAIKTLFVFKSYIDVR